MIDLSLHMHEGKALSYPGISAEERLQALIALCVKEDRLAQSQLYKNAFDFLYRIAIRYEKNHDDAIVIINEAFFKVLTNIRSYKPEAPFYPWIKTILIHTIINKFRKNNTIKNGRDNTIVSLEEEQVYHTIDAEIEKVIDSEHVLSILQQLPECTRNVFNLYVVEGYTHKDIADMLGISINTSKWHVAHGKKRLYEVLSGQKNPHNI